MYIMFDEDLMISNGRPLPDGRSPSPRPASKGIRRRSLNGRSQGQRPTQEAANILLAAEKLVGSANRTLWIDEHMRMFLYEQMERAMR